MKNFAHKEALLPQMASLVSSITFKEVLLILYKQLPKIEEESICPSLVLKLAKILIPKLEKAITSKENYATIFHMNTDQKYLTK